MGGVVDSASRRVWRAGLSGAAIAAVVNLALFLIGRAAGVSFIVGSGANEARVSAGHVVFSSVVALVLATGAAVFAASRPGVLRLVWVGAGVVSLASLTGPLQLGEDAATKALLGAMHLVVGAAFVVSVRGATARYGRSAGQGTVAPTSIGTEQGRAQAEAPRAS